MNDYLSKPVTPAGLRRVVGAFAPACAPAHTAARTAAAIIDSTGGGGAGRAHIKRAPDAAE
jgi:hypothetical protein